MRSKKRIRGGAVSIKLHPWGMFFEVARYISAVKWAKRHNALAMPLWSAEACRYVSEPPAHGDAWDVFFERAGHTWADAKHCPRSVKYNKTGRYCPISLKACGFPGWYEQIKPEGDANHVLGIPNGSEDDRQLLATFVRPQAEIADYIEQVYEKYLAGRHVIGLHVRGPGRYHDGTLLLQWYCKYTNQPPYDEYARLVEQHLRDDSVILLGTDAGCVAEHFKARWGEQVLCVEQHKRQLGEGHHHPEDSNVYQMGVHALLDAYLLARADVFVHGNSNMSNFIICMAPAMPREDVYAVARDVDFSTLPVPADIDIIKGWITHDPTMGP